MSAAAAAPPQADPCAFVVFGATGDLTRRKLLPSLYHLRANGLLPRDFTFVGVARRPLDDEGYRAQAERAVRELGGGTVDPALWKAFAEGLHYVQGDFEAPATYQAVGAALAHVAGRHGTAGNAVFYLATPPAEFCPIVRGLGEAGLVRAIPISTSKATRCALA